MSEILKAELQIVGSDKTGAAFAGVIKHAEELRSALGRIGQIGLGDAKLKEASAELRQQTALLKTQRVAAQELLRTQNAINQTIGQRTSLLQGVRHRMEGFAAGMGMYGWMAGGYAAGRTARAMAHDTSEFEHEKAILRHASGMKPEEVDRAISASLAARIPTMSAAANLKSIGELRMVFGSTEHAIEHMEAVQRAAAALKIINPEMDADKQAYDLARSLELKGISNDPAHFNRLQNMMVQAINATRGKVTASDFLSFTNRAGTGTTSTLSDFFYSRIAPTLIQEMTGPTAGRALATLRRQLLGGHMQIQSAGEWMQLGLLKRDHVEMDKIGHVKRIHPGAIIDSDLFSVDPYAWIQKYLAPALKKKGVTTDEKIASEMATLFSDRYAENMATILLKQKQRIEKDIGLGESAPGTEAIDKLRESDPKAALSDLASGIETLLSVLGSPLAGAALGAMNKIADAGRYLASQYAALAKVDPQRAFVLSGAAVGGLGYLGLKGLQSGFGLLTGATALKGSAAALTSSAAALNTAAGRLAAGGGPWGTAAGAAGGAAAASKWAGFLRWMPLWALGAYSIATTQDVMTKTRDGRKWDDIVSPYMPYQRARPGFSPSIKDFYDLGLLTHDHAGGIGSDFASSMREAKAELTGAADINAKITVEPSPDFITRIETMIHNGINAVRLNGVPGAGTAGSTGSAMPEAYSGAQP